MNVRKYTPMAESRLIKSVWQRHANKIRSWYQAPTRRTFNPAKPNQRDDAPSGLSGFGIVPITGRCPILMMMPFQGNKQSRIKITRLGLNVNRNMYQAFNLLSIGHSHIFPVNPLTGNWCGIFCIFLLTWMTSGQFDNQ